MHRVRRHDAVEDGQSAVRFLYHLQHRHGGPLRRPDVRPCRTHGPPGHEVSVTTCDISVLIGRNNIEDAYDRIRSLDTAGITKRMRANYTLSRWSSTGVSPRRTPPNPQQAYADTLARYGACASASTDTRTSHASGCGHRPAGRSSVATRRSMCCCRFTTPRRVRGHWPAWRTT